PLPFLQRALLCLGVRARRHRAGDRGRGPADPGRYGRDGAGGAAGRRTRLCLRGPGRGSDQEQEAGAGAGGLVPLLQRFLSLLSEPTADAGAIARLRRFRAREALTTVATTG